MDDAQLLLVLLLLLRCEAHGTCSGEERQEVSWIMRLEIWLSKGFERGGGFFLVDVT